MIHKNLFNAFSVRERLTDLLTEVQVRVCYTVVDDGIEQLDIYLAVFVKDAFIGAYVDYLTDTNAVLVEFYELAFDGHR